jgi:hypothetical protein
MTGKDAEDLIRMLSRITSGMHVYTTENEVAGKVKVYDRDAGMLVVEHGHLRHHEVHVPVSLVESVDLDTRRVQLSVSKEQLEWVTAVEPEQSLFENI